MTGEARTIKTAATTTSVERIDFGVVDAKGRAIGIKITRGAATFEPASDDTLSFYRIEAGDYFTAHLHTTRNGEKYGAHQMTSYFKTEAEREAHIAKQVAAAHKRHTKKHNQRG